MARTSSQQVFSCRLHGGVTKRLGEKLGRFSSGAAVFHNPNALVEEVGYISIDKSFIDRKPLMRARITDEGRKAFAAYLEAIAKLVGDR